MTSDNIQPKKGSFFTNSLIKIKKPTVLNNSVFVHLKHNTKPYWGFKK